jgi:transposase-like protein
MSRVEMQRAQDRAEVCWERDRDEIACELLARLPKNPMRVSRELAGTKEGNTLLIAHWEGLGDVLRTNGGWDEAQRALAFDLLGVPAVLRNGSTLVPAESDVAGLAALVESQLGKLREDREESLIALDEEARMTACAGMSAKPGPELSRLRKENRVLKEEKEILRKAAAFFAKDSR